MLKSILNINFISGLLDGLMSPATAFNPPEIQVIIEGKPIESYDFSFEKDAENIKNDFLRTWGPWEDELNEQRNTDDKTDGDS